MRTAAPLLTVCVLAGCAPPEPTAAAWLTAWSADWEQLNHRLSHLSLRPQGDGVGGTFVGGASTTRHVFDDEGTCIEARTCWELPARDQGLLTARLQEARAIDLVFATGTAELTVGRAGGEVTAALPLPRAVDGPVQAWIGGFAVDATAPLPAGAASCYDPRHGWLPQALQVAVGEAMVVGEAVEVPVSATFAAGLSLEAQRACLDAVAADALATVTVDVVALVGHTAGSLHTVRASAIWPDAKTPQSPEVLGDGVVDLAPGALIGWTSWSFRFHEVVEPGRGAYLRSLEIRADAETDEAFGYASNTSPLTQLSGFDYAFEGSLLELEAPEELVRLTTTAWSGELETLVDDAGQPVVHALNQE